MVSLLTYIVDVAELLINIANCKLSVQGDGRLPTTTLTYYYHHTKIAILLFITGYQYVQ